MSLSVIQRILLGFGVLLVLLLITAASGFIGIKQIEDRMNVVTGEVADISTSSNALKDELSLANAAVLQYLLSQSPDALDSLSASFETHKNQFSDVSSRLSQQLESQPAMQQELSDITDEVARFFDYTDVAFANHKTMLELQSAIPFDKLDLNDAIAFAFDDLEMLVEDGNTPEIQFAASFMQSQIDNLRLTVYDYLDTSDLNSLQTLRDSMQAIVVTLRDRQSYLKNGSINALLDEIEIGVSDENGVAAKHYENTRLKQASEVLAKQLSDSMASINESVSVLLANAQTMAVDATQEAKKAATLSVYLSGIILAVSVLIAVIVALWVSRSIRLPLNEVMSVLGKISEGDFTQRSKVNSKDEFGELSKWVNNLVSKLQTVMSDIDQSANEVAGSPQSNARRASDATRLVLSQNERTTEVASSMGEMAATVNQVAKSSEVILHQIQLVDQRSSQNRIQMDANIQKIEHLLEQIENSTLVVNQLNEYSQSIGRILEVIQEIAEQTNLLALNAAIEAARAGEQGRGFAVVADEVRTLATRTHTSTEEIQRVIDQLQSGVTKTVSSMETSRTSATASAEEARSVGLSLAELQHSMIEIRDLSTQIATAAEEQSAVAQEINQNVMDISRMSDEATQSAEQSEKESAGLSTLSSRQKALLSQFKIV